MSFNNSDNFEAILNLANVFSNEYRASRQQTASISAQLSKLATESGVSYEELSEPPTKENIQKFESITPQTEIELLTQQNYRLMLQIEQEQYLKNKICTMINSINEHLKSIKIFLMEQNFLEDNEQEESVFDTIEDQINNTKINRNLINASNEFIKMKVEKKLHDIKTILKGVDYSRLPTDTIEFKRFEKSVIYFNTTYNASLPLPPLK